MKKLSLSLLVVLIFGSHLVIAQSHAEINWPSGFAPEEARFFVWNETEINAPAQMVWEELIRAEAWPDWYEGAENVKIEGGYAKEVSAEFLDKQQKLIQDKIKDADLVITTALVMGKKSPILVTEDMVKSMKTGSVIVDMGVGPWRQ